MQVGSEQAALSFEATATCFSIEIAEDAFLDLLDSESHVTENAAYAQGQQTLGEKLDRTVARDVEYDGHFGAAVYLKIEAADDTPANREAISQAIREHLTWCATLNKRSDVVARRSTPKDPHPCK